MESTAKKRCLFILGVGICFSVAAVSILVEHLIPGELLGAAIIALFTGTIINRFFHQKWIQHALKFRGIIICQYDYVCRQNDLFCDDIYICYVLRCRIFYPQAIRIELETLQLNLRRNRHLRWFCRSSHCSCH